ncbi:hypothetical protein HC341_15925 [Aquisalimonas sp. 2447]|uniref:hypothetical protein n=1 Tax=Aquisalimonas sp. 2447 TaxID=2740807 RepID=UPI001432613F|nr:hypothetical protein [Aquisalimonas sp. 2447]QIT56552.1 hypothetical protein HC341_15925 [Aquisalimonas sp. 2447]
MIIGEPQTAHHDGALQYSTPLYETDLPMLWFTVPEEHGGLVSHLADAAVLALLIPCMAVGEDIHVDGPMSERLYQTISGPYQRLLIDVIPSLRPVTVTGTELVARSGSGAGVASGFSSGIDSYCVLADYYYGDPVDSFKLTHLLYNNVGSHGGKGEELFHRRFEQVSRVTNEIGLPLVKVNSNVEVFYPASLTFQMTHTPRNAAVALLLQEGIGRYMYASSYQYKDMYIGEANSMAYSDPASLPLLGTDQIEMIAVGSEYIRTEKTQKVAGLADSYRHLDVCVKSETGENCSKCSKCLRTLLTLEILGKLEAYADSFDLAAYRDARDGYIVSILRQPGPLEREIVALAECVGFDIPNNLQRRASLENGLAGIRTSARIPVRFIKRLAKHALRGRAT